jgi:single-stranded nucleic acid binding R3H domain-containing protein
MEKTVRTEGKTTTEAIEKGLKELGVSKDKVEIKVLEEEKRSFYSILSPRVVKVELTLKEDKKEKNKEEKKHNENIQEIEKAEQDIKEFLDNFLTKETKYEVKINNFDIYVDMNGENLNYLIGYRGETINAIQTILTAIANKKSTQKIRVYLDIAGYREKRIKTLEDLAEKLARTVERTKKSVTLEPMTAYERKIIHSKLQENEKIDTHSIGEEPNRRIVISKK